MAGGKSAPPWRGGDRRIVHAEECSHATLWCLRQANERTRRGPRLIETVHQVFCVRGFAEFVQELVGGRLVDEAELDRRLAAYARLDPQIVDALGAPFPPQDHLSPRRSRDLPFPAVTDAEAPISCRRCRCV